jgi:hypothetical protein
MSRTAAVLDSLQASEGQAWWFLDTLVVEHPMASGAGPVVLAGLHGGARLAIGCPATETQGPSAHAVADAGPLPPRR